MSKQIPAPDATISVNYWTLDCLLDWADHVDEGPWDAGAHYDELRATLDAQLAAMNDDTHQPGNADGNIEPKP